MCSLGLVLFLLNSLFVRFIHLSRVLAVHSCCYRANFFCAGPESKDFKFVSHIVSVATTIVSDAGEKSLRQNVNK